MKTIGAFEAKTRFSELLRDVEAGESFEIRRRGKAVARLEGIPANPGREQAVREMLVRVRPLRRAVNASPAEIVSWIKEGRKR